MVAYLKVEPQVRTYSDYLRAAREPEKEGSIELSWNPRIQASDGLSKPRPTRLLSLEETEGYPTIP